MAGTSIVTDIDHKAEIDRHFAWFQSKLSPRMARFVGWLLPLGLVLIAQDVPVLQKPMAQMLGWIERKWIARQRAKESR